jgi:hypothetical protein
MLLWCDGQGGQAVQDGPLCTRPGRLTADTSRPVTIHGNPSDDINGAICGGAMDAAGSMLLALHPGATTVLISQPMQGSRLQDASQWNEVRSNAKAYVVVSCLPLDIRPTEACRRGQTQRRISSTAFGGRQSQCAGIQQQPAAVALGGCAGYGLNSGPNRIATWAIARSRNAASNASLSLPVKWLRHQAVTKRSTAWPRL